MCILTGQSIAKRKAVYMECLELLYVKQMNLHYILMKEHCHLYSLLFCFNEYLKYFTGCFFIYSLKREETDAEAFM
jgi:hypothetical protein